MLRERHIQETARGTEQVTGNIAGAAETQVAASQVLGFAALSGNAEAMQGVIDRFLAGIRAA